MTHRNYPRLLCILRDVASGVLPSFLQCVTLSLLLIRIPNTMLGFAVSLFLKLGLIFSRPVVFCSLNVSCLQL